MAERVESLRRVASARAYVHQSPFGPAERGDVGALLLKREGPQVGPLCRVELAEKVVQLRERDRFGELAGAIGEEREDRLGLEVRTRRFLDLAQIGMRSADDVPEPGALRRCAVADQAECLVRLVQRLTRPAEITQRLRRPRERARQSLGVASTAKLSCRVAVVRESALVVAAHAMQKSAQEDDPRQPPFRTGRESIEPALQGRDLAPAKCALAVVADELCRASMIPGLLEVMDRAVDVAACRGAFRVPAVELDDLGGGEELSRSRAEELGEERLEAMASVRAFARDEARLLERGKELA